MKPLTDKQAFRSWLIIGLLGALLLGLNLICFVWVAFIVGALTLLLSIAALIVIKI